jgi:hypothetical protein
MSWHYQCSHYSFYLDDGEVDEVYEVREVYVDLHDDGHVGISWSGPLAPISESKEGLIEVLERMLADVKDRDVLELPDEELGA